MISRLIYWLDDLWCRHRQRVIENYYVLIADTDREHYTQIPLSEIVKAIQDENYVGEKRSYLDVWQAAGHSLLWKFYHSEDGKDERAVPS